MPEHKPARYRPAVPLFVVHTFSVAKEVQRLRLGAQHHPDDFVSIVGLVVELLSHGDRVGPKVYQTPVPVL